MSVLLKVMTTTKQTKEEQQMTKKIIIGIGAAVVAALAALGVCKIIDLIDDTTEKEKKYRRLSSGLDEEDELELIDLDVQNDIYDDNFAEKAEANK